MLYFLSSKINGLLTSFRHIRILFEKKVIVVIAIRYINTMLRFLWHANRAWVSVVFFKAKKGQDLFFWYA